MAGVRIVTPTEPFPTATLTLPLRVPDPIDWGIVKLAAVDTQRPEWREYRMVAFTARRRWPFGRWKMNAKFEEVT